MGHHIYEENKRLKAEIESLHERLRDRITECGDQPIDVLAREALKQILTGKAALVTMDGNDPGARITYFQMLTPPAVSDDNQPSS